MRILLPSESFRVTAEILGDRELKQQCFDARQLTMTLEGKIALGNSQSTIDEWTGCNGALALYGFVMCTEARRRGFRVDRAFFGRRVPKGDFPLPNWTDDAGE